MRKGQRYAHLKEISNGIYRVQAIVQQAHQDAVHGTSPVVAVPSEKTNAELLNCFYYNGAWFTPEELAAKGTSLGIGTGRELLWSGHVYDYSGYAKANRELLFRVSKTFQVKLSQEGLGQESFLVEPHVVYRLNSLKKNEVSREAPLLRFYTPRPETKDRFRVCFTMMETERTHPDFIKRLNENYNEVWVPTEWNKNVFIESGLRIDCRVVPLGVDPSVYCPGTFSRMPACELVTTARAGATEIPQGFTFISVFQPTFRKGLQHLLPAFEEAFADDPEVSLILGATTHSPRHYPVFYESVKQHTKNSRVYALTGRFSENEMANHYRACQAFVSMSLGEGWNLPMVEAAACGLPVIIPRNTAHLDIADDTCVFFIDPEGQAAYPAAREVCEWYDAMPFSLFSKKSHDQLVATLRSVKNNYSSALARGAQFTKKVRSFYSWDDAYTIFMQRFSELAVSSNRKYVTR